MQSRDVQLKQVEHVMPSAFFNMGETASGIIILGSVWLTWLSAWLSAYEVTGISTLSYCLVQTCGCYKIKYESTKKN